MNRFLSSCSRGSADAVGSRPTIRPDHDRLHPIGPSPCANDVEALRTIAGKRHLLSRGEFTMVQAYGRHAATQPLTAEQRAWLAARAKRLGVEYNHDGADTKKPLFGSLPLRPPFRAAEVTQPPT